MSRVVPVSRDELLARREATLHELGVSLPELEERAQQSTLIGAEWDAWEALDDIAFLLGDE